MVRTIRVPRVRYHIIYIWCMVPYRMASLLQYHVDRWVHIKMCRSINYMKPGTPGTERERQTQPLHTSAKEIYHTIPYHKHTYHLQYKMIPRAVFDYRKSKFDEFMLRDFCTLALYHITFGMEPYPTVKFVSLAILLSHTSSVGT